MKRLILLTAFALCSHLLFAQNREAIVSAESSYINEDTTKLRMQITLAYEFARDNPDSGLLYAAKAIKLATRIKNFDMLGDAYRYQSGCYYYKEDFLTAINSLQQAAKSYRQANFIWKVAYIHLSIADDYRHLSLFPQAIDHIMKSIQYFEKIEFPYGTAYAVQNLGLIYMSRKEYEKALFQFHKEEQIVEKATDINTKGLLSTTYLNIGDAYMHMHNDDSSIVYNQKAVEMFRKEKKQKLLVNALFNLSFSNQNKGNRLQGLNYLQQVVAICRASGDSLGVASAMDNIANLYVDFKSGDLSKLQITPTQQYRQAMNLYRQAIDIRKEHSSSSNIIIDLYNFADLYSRIPDSLLKPLGLTEAIRDKEQVAKIDEGLKIARKLSLLDMQQIGYQKLSEVYEKQKNNTGALQAYKNFILIRDSISSAEGQKKIV